MDFYQVYNKYGKGLQCPNIQGKYSIICHLTLVMLNELRCHAHFWLSANQIPWSRLLINIHIVNGK